jgi:hypothetical protein
MLNLAGPSYDFGNVLFAVLQECEHVRRGLLPNAAEARLQEIARAKLAEVRVSYEELGGTGPYWEDLEREVMEAMLPQYIPAAVEQTRMERNSYDLWRHGDPAARALLTLIGLILGGLIVKAPFIPIAEDTFAFFLAAAFFLYPEIKQLYFDRRHARFLNRLIIQAEKYQKDNRLHYASEARFQEEMGALDEKTAEPVTARKKAGRRKAEAAGDPQPPQSTKTRA